MPQETYPTGQVPATVARWARIGRRIGPRAVLGTIEQNPYGLTVSGLTATIGRGVDGVAEAWVGGFMHTLIGADWSVAVPANGHATQARRDRIVLRWDPDTETAALVHLQGTPAAAPEPPDVEQDPTGVDDLPLWTFTVPANNGAPLTAPTDDRVFLDVNTGASGGVDVTAAWTATLMRAGTSGYTGVAWSPQLRRFCAVGGPGITNQVATSPDGVTWTSSNINNSVGGWSSVVWVAELALFVAVATSTSTSAAATSPDGITWATRTVPAASTGYTDVVWSPQRGLLVAVAHNAAAAGRVITSPDGITWTSRTLTAASTSGWNGVAWSAELGLFVAVGGASGTTDAVATSPDGITWTLRVVPTTGATYYAVAWSGERGVFVAVGFIAGTASAVMSYSTNGVTWINATAPGGTWSTVRWSDALGLFLAVANTGSGPRVAVSRDGIAWSTRASANDGLAWDGLAVGGASGRLAVAVSSTTPQAMITAPATP